MLVHRGEEGLPLCLEVADPDTLAVPLMRDQVKVLTLSVAGRGWLCRMQRIHLRVRVTAAEFGVGVLPQRPGGQPGLRLPLAVLAERRHGVLRQGQGSPGLLGLGVSV